MIYREGMPDLGELVVATVTQVSQRYGAKVKLDEYKDVEGLIPINEVASGWVKNIRDYLQEGKKIVGVVIEVNKKLHRVTLSMRRVSEGQRKRKLVEWKRTVRGYKLLELVAQKLGIPVEKAYKQFGKRLERVFGSIYRAFEECAENPKVLEEEGFKGKWVKVFVEVAKANITLRRISIEGRFLLQSLASDGIERIKKFFTEMHSVLEKDEYSNVDIQVIYEGAPRYRVRIIAPEYPLAEKVLEDVLSFAESFSKREGVTYEFERIKERGK